MTDARAEKARENGKKGGRPKGRKNNATLEVEKVFKDTNLDRKMVLKTMQQRIMRAADVLLNAQLSRARGQAFLYRIEKYWETFTDDKGKTRKILKSKPPKLVTDEWEIRDYLEKNAEGPIGINPSSPEDDYYFITTKEPDSATAERLFNRVFGNSVQPISLVDDDGKSVFSEKQKELSDQAINAYLEPPKKASK